MGNFASSIRNWKGNTLSQIDEGVNYALKNFTDTVIEQTPVDYDPETMDEIVAKDNWSLENAGDDGEMVLSMSAGGEKSKEKVNSKLRSWRATKNGKLVFMNNAHDKNSGYYANILEFGLYKYGKETKRTRDGYSKQAIGGFVRKNLVEFHFGLRDFFGKSITGFTRIL